jgi:glycosyltransferase involved in cell wall biosynthesis
VIPHGVDLSQFVPGSREIIERGKVLFVGRLIELKGLRLLIDALTNVRQRFPEISLTVVGDGPMRRDFEAHAREKLKDRCTFLGSQPQAIVQEHMKEAQIFSVPSISMPTGEAEAFGLVFVEAQAMRVPVVAFACGGVPEVVAHGETGFLAKEGHVEELAAYLQQLLEQPKLCEQMGEAGRRRVEQLFDLEKQNAMLEALYDDLRAAAGERV